MLVLVGEVYYYKKKSKNKQQLTFPQFATKIKPLDNFDYADKKLKSNKILLGHGEFMPTNIKQPRLSFVSQQFQE